MVLIFSLFIGIALDFAGAKPADSAIKYYATKYDHIDVEAILNNRRMVNYYSACLLSQGPCPPEGVEFKRILPEALKTNCGRCTEKQATVAFHAIKRIRKEYPKVWAELSAKWDPDEIYVKKFESTFPFKHGSSKPFLNPQPAVLNAFGDDDDTSDNDINIDGGSLSTTTSHQDPIIRTVLTTSNSISPPSTTSINTKTTANYPYLSTTTRPSTTFRTSTTTILFSTTDSRISTTSNKSTTSVIPGLIPINTFFTNPPIPVRPLVNLNIGANIGATVRAIKEVERIVAGVAMEKLGFIKNILFPPLRKRWRKNS